MKCESGESRVGCFQPRIVVFLRWFVFFFSEWWRAEALFGSRAPAARGEKDAGRMMRARGVMGFLLVRGGQDRCEGRESKPRDEFFFGRFAVWILGPLCS